MKKDWIHFTFTPTMSNEFLALFEKSQALISEATGIRVEVGKVSRREENVIFVRFK